MRNLKKVLGLILCLAMMLSLMVVGAGAAFTDQSDIDEVHQDAVNMCVSLSIIDGFEDGSFKPTDNVTREQMAKMICVLDNGGKDPQGATGNTFTDVPADRWSNKYVEACNARGVVSGVGDNKYDPASDVTPTQAAKMLLVELGFKADIANYEGDQWATYVNIDATKKGYYTDLEDIDTTAPMSREHAAQMIWNALQAKEVDYKDTLVTDENGQLISKVDVVDKAITLLADKYGAQCDDSAQMIGFTYNSDKEEWTYFFGDEFEGEYGDYEKFTSDQDYTGLYGQDVKVVYTEKTNGNVDKVLGMFVNDSVVLASGYVGDFDEVKADDDSVTVSDADYDLYQTGADTMVYLFTYGKDSFESQQTESIEAVVADPANKGFEICAIDYDDNGDIDFFVMKCFIVDQVDSMATKTFTLANTSGNFKYDKVDYYDEMAEDDFVVYTPAAYTTINKDNFAPVDSVLAGKVDATKGGYKFSVDGTWYESTKELGLNPGNNLKDAPVVNGYVFDGSASNTSSVEDYAVVIAADKGAYANTAKLMFSDGTKKVVDTDTYYTNLDSQLVYFEVNSDDEYVLTAANTQIEKEGDTIVNNDTGFDDYADAFVDNDVNSSGKIKYISGNNINDDAVIFMKDGDSYKVITGAQLKTVKNDDFGVFAFVEENSETGYNSVVLAYVVAAEEAVAADVTYGFILDNAVSVKNEDDKTVYEFTIWTDEGKEVTLQTKAGLSVDTATFKEGALVSFSVNNDGVIDKLNELDGEYAYVSAWDGTYIQVNGDSSQRFEVTDDSTVIYINVADSEGSASGSIQKAAKSSTGYYNNVYVIFDGDEVDVMFVDINKDIQNQM